MIENKPGDSISRALHDPGVMMELILAKLWSIITLDSAKAATAVRDWAFGGPPPPPEVIDAIRGFKISERGDRVYKVEVKFYDPKVALSVLKNFVRMPDPTTLRE